MFDFNTPKQRNIRRTLRTCIVKLLQKSFGTHWWQFCQYVTRHLIVPTIVANVSIAVTVLFSHDKWEIFMVSVIFYINISHLHILVKWFPIAKYLIAIFFPKLRM